MKRPEILYIINILLLFFSLIVMATGVIKFPGLLPAIGIDPYSLNQGLLTELHDWLGIAIVGLSLLHMVLHWNWLAVMTKKLWGSRQELIAIILVLIILPLAFIRARSDPIEQRAVEEAYEESQSSQAPSLDDMAGDFSSTAPQQMNRIRIEDVGEFEFDAAKISAMRDDVFKPGYFSIFDILVHLDENDQIDMEYVFSEVHDTHLIESINGISNWWYVAYYDGGWPERNVWRMDLYPYKDLSDIRVSKVSERFLDMLYTTFEEEVIRKEENRGKIIVPQIVIRTREAEKLVFENIEIKPYNLRPDFFHEGTVTALDAILTLGELGEIRYELNWYETIGRAELVKNYFVDSINDDRSYDRCGFVYETGSRDFYGFDGNHIHIASDLRVLTSPEYIEFFWICI